MTLEVVEKTVTESPTQPDPARNSIIDCALSFGQEVYNYWQPRVMQYFYKPNEKKELLGRLQSAGSYEQWHDIALRIDALEGNDIWRSDPASPYYDYKLIASLIFKLKQLCHLEKLDELAEVIRSGLLRNMGSIATSELYTGAYGGTKLLIEEYISTVVSSLIYLSRVKDPNTVLSPNEIPAESPQWPADRATLRTYFKDTQQSYGRTSLILHGGTLFGLCHLGVVKGLLAERLLPTVICGTTIGSIAAAYVCSVPDSEIHEAITRIPLLIMSHNEDQGDDITVSNDLDDLSSDDIATDTMTENISKSSDWLGNITTSARRTFFPRELMMFLRFVIKHLGDMTFEEAYLKSGRILNILILPAGSGTGTFYNYLTTPKVIVRSAVLASIGSRTLPGNPHIDLLIKDYQGKICAHPDSPMEFLPANQRTFVPARDSPYTRLSELFNVNNYVVSISRPYFAPILLSEFKYRGQPRLWHKFISLVRMSAQYRLSQLADWGLLSPQLKAVFVDEIIPGGFQVNVVPETDALIRDFMLLFDSTNIWMKAKHWIDIGEKSVWPQMSIIWARSKIEYTLEQLYEEFA